MISPTLYEPMRCAVCKQDATGHDRVTGACYVYARAEVKPYALRLRRVPAAASGWRVSHA